MKQNIKRIVLSFVFSTALLINIKSVEAAPYVLFERTKTKTISKGVTYTSLQQVTDEGLRDIHLIKVPANDPNIKVNNTTSLKDFNLKEATSALLVANGAIGGVNGDFFNLTGTHSIVQGPIVKNDSIVAADNINNSEKNEYATFYMTEEGTPFIDYIKTDIDFINDGAEYVKVHYMNKVPNVILPVYIDSKAMSDTTPVDSQFPNVTKIVVEDNIITYISKKGEVVKVPENGYIILIGEDSIDYIKTVVHIGEKAEIRITSQIDFNKLYTAIGGGGKILTNGNLIKDSGFVVSGRQPRTAVGFDADKSFIYFVVVDGRTYSIGATHEELANILKRFGITDAMHLDGGGSTTMAVKEVQESQVKMVNNPSGGYERKVANALGVYNKSQVGELTSLKINLKSDNLIMGLGNRCEIIGFDDYFNRVELNSENISVTSTDPNSYYKDGLFYPSQTGKLTITAQYGGITEQKEILSVKLAELTPEITKIKTSAGIKTDLSFTGKSVEGISTYIYDGLKYEIVPADIGTMEGNTFTALKDGVGYIKVSILDVVYYIDVAVGLKTQLISSFEESLNIGFSSVPETLTGKAGQSWENVVDGQLSLALKYKFEPSESTQAAYLQFKDKLLLKNDPTALRLSVYGDASKNWLRGRILDSAGNEFSIDFAKEIDWTGYKEVLVQIPQNVQYPVYLDRIYVASLANADTKEYSLYFDKLIGEVPIGTAIKHPNNSKFYDIMVKDLANDKTEGGFDMTVVGDLDFAQEKKPADYLTLQQKAVNALAKNSSKGLVAGTSDYQNDYGVSVFKWAKYYAFYEHNKVGVIYMNSQNGNFYNSNLEQWQNFYKDISTRNKKNIIIATDLDPTKLKSNKEFELFHDTLVELRNNEINIFVVSTEGSGTKSDIRDGIRYINLGGLFNSDGSVNNNFRVLRLRVVGNNIYYDFDKVF